MNQGKCPGRILYADEKDVYQSKEALLNFLIEHMPNPEGLPAEELYSQYVDMFILVEHETSSQQTNE